MGVEFFIYTLALITVCIIAGALCSACYFVSHRRLFLYGVALFLFYLFDVALIFQNEFLSQNLAFDSTGFYEVSNPIWKIVMGGGFVGALQLIAYDCIDERRLPALLVPPALFVVGSAAVLLLVPEGRVQQFSFYTMRQVYMALVFGVVALRYLRTRDEVERLRLRRYRGIALAAGALIALITLEDVLMILLLPANTFPPGFPMYLTERNFSENALLLLCAFVTLRTCDRTLSLRFEQPPAREEEPLRRHIDDVLPLYCRRHGLSEREGEILALILTGSDNQNIASRLQLALGTVKAHVHNILKKTGAATRQDLIRDFWSE